MECIDFPNKKRSPEGERFSSLTSKTRDFFESVNDYFNASNTRAVISSILPKPEIARYLGASAELLDNSL